MDMPTLTGSEKQVAWANTLRAQRITAWNEWRAEAMDAAYHGWTEDEAARGVARVAAIEAWLTANVFARTEAKFWIDGRSTPLRSLITQAPVFENGVYRPEWRIG